MRPGLFRCRGQGRVTLVVFEVMVKHGAVQRRGRAGADPVQVTMVVVVITVFVMVSPVLATFSTHIFGTDTDGALIGLVGVELGGWVVEQEGGRAVKKPE
jgi:hypothetical protein